MNSLTLKSIVILTFFASLFTLWVPSAGETSPPFNPTPEHDECSIYPREPECSEHEDICVWHSRRRRCGIKLFGKRPPKNSTEPEEPAITEGSNKSTEESLPAESQTWLYYLIGGCVAFIILGIVIFFVVKAARQRWVTNRESLR